MYEFCIGQEVLVKYPYPENARFRNMKGRLIPLNHTIACNYQHCRVDLGEAGCPLFRWEELCCVDE